jgi:hypothetical protein
LLRATACPPCVGVGIAALLQLVVPPWRGVHPAPLLVALVLGVGTASVPWY